MASSSLRTRILHHALTHVPEHSFTLRPLLNSLSTLPPSHADYDRTVSPEVLDVLFGSELNARQELVREWEEEGLRSMTQVGSAHSDAEHKPASRELDTIAGVLRRRLEYSSRIGEHLVEAQALLAAPGSAPSLPVPTRTLSILSSLLPSLPPLYRPPGSSPITTAATDQTASFFSSLLAKSNDRLPLLRVNPLGPLSYAWRISDAAWHHVESARGLKKGAAGEPVGAGPEWYTARVGLSLVYLAAESHLLNPPSARHTRDSSEGDQSNDQLPQALRALDVNLRRYEQVMSTLESGEQTAGDMLGYLGFIGRAWAGIIRSRGW